MLTDARSILAIYEGHKYAYLGLEDSVVILSGPICWPFSAAFIYHCFYPTIALFCQIVLGKDTKGIG